MTSDVAHWWLNLASLVGIARTAIPTWSLNVMKKKLQRIREILPEEPAAFKGQVKVILEKKRDREASDWRSIDEKCLMFGYLLLFASAFLRLLVPIS